MSKIRSRFLAMQLGLVLCTAPWLTSCMSFGCSLGPVPAGITAADLTGSYTASTGGSVKLAANGHATVSEWIDDRYVAGGPEYRPRATTGTATWKLANRDYGPVVELDMDLPDGHRLGTTLDITGSRAQPKLWEFIGDPDSCEFHTLTKQP